MKLSLFSKKMLYCIALLSFSILASCSKSNPVDPPLRKVDYGNNFRANTNETVQVDNPQGNAIALTVTDIFDTRCAPGQTCPNPGKAIVKLKLTNGSQLLAETSLCIGQCTQGATNNTDVTIIRLGDINYTITLFSVTPGTNNANSAELKVVQQPVKSVTLDRPAG